MLIILFKQFFSRSSNVIVITYFKDFYRINHVPTFLIWPQKRQCPSTLKFFKNLWPNIFLFSPELFSLTFRSFYFVSLILSVPVLYWWISTDWKVAKSLSESWLMNVISGGNSILESFSRCVIRLKLFSLKMGSSFRLLKTDTN